MSKKNELKTLSKQMVDAIVSSVKAMQNGDISGYDYYNTKVENLSGKFDVLAGNKAGSYEQNVESRVASYGCSESHLEAYGDSQNFNKIHYCMGIISQVSLDVIDEMF